MSDKLYLGLDLSLADSGVCIINSGGEIVKIGSVITVNLGSRMDKRFKRYAQSAKGIKSYILENNRSEKIACCAVEQYSFGSKGRMVQIVENGTMIRYVLRKYGVENIIEPYPMQLKKFLLGKVNKEMNAKNILCREVYKRYKVEINNDNQVDAFILAQLARTYDMYYSDDRKNCVIQKHQKEVIEKIFDSNNQDAEE